MRLIFVIVFIFSFSAQTFAQQREDRIETYSCGGKLRVKVSQIDRAVQFMDIVYANASPSCTKKPSLLNRCCEICLNYLKYKGTHFPVPRSDDILLKKIVRVNNFRRKYINRYYAVAHCSRVHGCLFLGIIRRPRYNLKEIKCDLMLEGLPASRVPIGFPQPSAPPGVSA